MSYFEDWKKSSVLKMATISLCAVTLATITLINSVESVVDQIQTSNFNELGAFYFLVIGILSTIAFLYCTWQLLRWARYPDRHPVERELSRFGEPKAIAAQIEMELSVEKERFGTAIVLDNWIIDQGFISVSLMRFDELIWAYTRQTDNRTNYVRMDSDWGVVLHDVRNRSIELRSGNTLKKQMDQATRNRMEMAYKHVLRRAPWVKVGFSEDFQALVQNNGNRLNAILDAEISTARNKTE